MEHLKHRNHRLMKNPMKMKIISVYQKYPVVRQVCCDKFKHREFFFCLEELYMKILLTDFPDSIRCENLEDGIYALDCSDKVVVCSRGWKRIYECPTGQLFIPALKKCDESWRCTDASTCGSGFVGVIYLGRIETFEQAHSPPSIGIFF